MNVKTKKHNRFCSALALLFAVAALVTLLTGCGTAAEPTVTESAENTFNKTLVVATDDDYWPYVYYDETGSSPGTMLSSSPLLPMN